MRTSVVGHTAIDFLLRVDELPSPNSSVPVKKQTIAFGGGAANICVGITKLGGSSELISPVGKDFIGSQYHSYLKEIGVETSLYFSDKETSRAYVITDKKKNQVTYFYWGASEDFERMKPVKREFVHLATGSPIYNRKVAELSDFVSFDPGQDIVNYDSEGLWGVLSSSDMLICNRFEITKIFSMLGMDMNELLEILKFVIVTCDAGGSIVYTHESSHHIKAVEVNVVDPTGAGDGYRAGLFVGMQKGYDIVTSAKIGSVVASFVIESEGAQTNLPDWEKTLNRYKKEFGEIPQKS